MLAKNQTVMLNCTGLGADFEGICRHEGQVVFVRGALPGETLRAKVIKASKQYAVARLEQLQTFSPARNSPPCPYYPRCGGCTAQHLQYEETLRYKRQQVVDCLERIGGFAAPVVRDTVGMENPWRYRNKGAFPVGGKAGHAVIGIYAARSHDIVDAPRGCLLQSVQSDALVHAVRGWMDAFSVPPYDEKAQTGLVRHVMTREAADGTMMLVLVINGRQVPHANELISAAAEAAPGLRSIILSENIRDTNVILGDRFRTLWGEDTLTDAILGFSMRVSPRSFFQVNRTQAERLFETAVACAGLTGAEMVWDVYCGAGSITLPLAARAKHVVGIEVVADAVEDARVNAAANGVENAAFLTGTAEALLPKLVAEKGRPDVVVLDPPRKGCEPAALVAIAKARPGRIVYVSCNPATLARDCGILAKAGYTIKEVTPVDMFGWTGHIESVTLLEASS